MPLQVPEPAVNKGGLDVSTMTRARRTRGGRRHAARPRRGGSAAVELPRGAGYAAYVATWEDDYESTAAAALAAARERQASSDHAHC